MSRSKRTFWIDDDRGPMVGWAELSNEWDDPTFDAVAGELELEAELSEQREVLVLELMKLVLTDKQCFVLERLWGLNGHEPYSVREVGEAMGVSHVAVQYLERRGIEKLAARCGVTS